MFNLSFHNDGEAIIAIDDKKRMIYLITHLSMPEFKVYRTELYVH